MLSRNIVPEEPPRAAASPPGDAGIVLIPVTHPELGEIRIDEELFAIGRNEAPFDSYAPEIVADLSRRHARIFAEYGAVYIADLDSKNGTSVNGTSVRQKTSRLREGDEIRFGRGLAYRVHLGARAGMTDAPRADRLASLTLTPEREDLGLQPIVINSFPFLISKIDDSFARYKDEYPHQVNYLSRRHAHIFLKGGQPFLEDLGSTNGTFVEARRLDERAVPLADGDAVAFGGHHFVYKVSLQKEVPAAEPTLTMLAPSLRAPAAEPGSADKTTFVAAPDSFLDIFCIESSPAVEDEVNEEASATSEASGSERRKRKRGRIPVFLSELREAFGGGEKRSRPGRRWIPLAVLVAVAAPAYVLYQRDAPERELKRLVAGGDYARAATLANQQLQRTPDDPQLQALSTEALLKADVPRWLKAVKARDFERAGATLADMKALGANNPDIPPLVNELAWIGDLEQFAASRGGADAPIRIFGDDNRIRALLQRWNEDTGAHQRASSRIAAYVPAFREPYADALSQLRKLQSEDAVYLAAIDRLKSSIETELDKDRPETLDALFQEYAEKYPRLSGLDELRGDLRQYLDIERESHARRLTTLVPLVAKANFATPPFAARFNKMTASGALPSADLVKQYEAASSAWRAGDSEKAMNALQAMSAGPWAEAAGKLLAHKKSIAEQFAALKKARTGKGYDERLLAFYGALDPEEDSYFVHAVEADVGAYRDKALKRAQGLLDRAQGLWTRYRDNGAIGGVQRLESGVSDKFRSQARLLSQARDDARQGMRIYTQLKAEYPAPRKKLADEINAEAELQRRSLLELHRVLEPAQLKAKLALLGESDNEDGKPAAPAD